MAIAFMVVDHIGMYLLDNNIWLRLAGRGAAPLFYFLVGYAGKVHVNFWLCFYGIILTLSNYLINGTMQVNILLSFIALHYAFIYVDAAKINTLGRIGLFIVCSVGTVFVYNTIEYGLLGFLIAYSARFIALKEKHADLWLISALVIYYLWECLYFQFTASIAMLTAFGVLVLFLYIVMSQFRQTTLPCPRFLVPMLLLLSRYSLEVYFMHLILLQAYSFLHLN